MKRYDNIQVLRVLACLGVFVSHLAPKMGATGKIAEIANFGASGVYLFFLVSAFLAFAGMQSRNRKAEGEAKDGESRITKRTEILRYYGKRACKILPLYYAVIFYNFLLHTFLLQDVPADPSGLGWLRYLFLTNAFIPAPNNFWSNLTATWTISLFAVFYLCAPFLFRWVNGEEVSAAASIQKTGRQKTGQYSRIIRAAVLYVVSVVLQQIWMELPCAGYMMCFYYMNFFALGILVWALSCPFPVSQEDRKGKCLSADEEKKKVFESREAKDTEKNWQQWKAMIPLAGICIGLGLLLFLWKGEIPYFTGISWIFAFVVFLTQEFSWKKALEWPMAGKIMTVLQKLFAVLDRHSYAIYLVHAVVIDGMVLVLARVSLPGWAVGAVTIALTAAGVWVADCLVLKMVKMWRREGECGKLR